MNLRDLQVISDPYPVLVFDNVFEPSLVRAAHAVWPHPEWDNWHRYNDKYSVKYGSKDGRQCPPPCLTLLDEMSRFPLQDFFGPLAIHNRHYFPDMSYHAGGLHCIQPGGKLDCHIDALSHPLRPWQRVANLLLYVNPNWQMEWGGGLVLHNPDKSFRDQLFPNFNRLVIFCPTDFAFHSVDPIAQEAQARCVLASFFWEHSLEAERNTTAKFEDTANGKQV